MLRWRVFLFAKVQRGEGGSLEPIVCMLRTCVWQLLGREGDDEEEEGSGKKGSPPKSIRR